MDEAVVTPDNLGKTQVKRDKKGRFLKGVSGNPAGFTGPKTLTAQQTIEALYKVKGPAALEEIVERAFKLLDSGNTTLLCKILDKILPSKTETKADVTITHREEFIRMRARAMEILETYKVHQN